MFTISVVCLAQPTLNSDEPLLPSLPNQSISGNFTKRSFPLRIHLLDVRQDWLVEDPVWSTSVGRNGLSSAFRSIRHLVSGNVLRSSSLLEDRDEFLLSERLAHRHWPQAVARANAHVGAVL